MADKDLFDAMALPMSFGKQPKKKVEVPAAGKFDKSRRIHFDSGEPQASTSVAKPIDRTPEPGPSTASTSRIAGPSTAPLVDNGEEDEDDEDEDDADEDDMQAETEQFPISHEVTLQDHTKLVSALTLDSSGARILSGSHDYDCKMWDFGGMGGNHKPFRSWEPAGSYYVHDLRYSPAGDSFLVISGNAQAKLYDRDGEEKATYVKGDPYIRDMRNTAGHVGELTSCAWHPKEANTFITSSMDSTIRIWDVENRRKQKSVIVVKSKERGARTKVTSCAYSADGKIIAGACFDGTLNLWQSNSNFVRPSQTAEGAHTKGTETGSVVFSIDGRTLLSRGGDDTVKLWDTRSFRKPLHASTSPLPSLYPEQNAIFSPDEKHIVVGCSQPSKGGRGRLVFLKRDTLEEVQTIWCGDGEGVVKVVWHSKINQILLGLSSGAIRILYSPTMSQNGAKLIISRVPKKVTIEDASRAMMTAPIITPHALPMFRDDAERNNKRKRDKDRFDARKTKRPMPPVSGPGKGGRVGASATQHVVQSLVRDTTRDEDPREALLRYADLAERDPQWTGAWKKNQPVPVFAQEQEEEKEEEGGA